MGTISRNFDYSEFEVTNQTRYKYKNMIKTADVRDSVKSLVTNILQPLRDKWGEPLHINSGYRCPEVNKAVGGVPTSQHTKGEAADVACTNPYRLANMVKQMGLPFDQMILYPSFLHISHKLHGTQRGNILYNKSYKGQRFQ